ncbi:MAG: 16S rRNA (adenine(1518)-N(6)/adenine(1519)-N(6))-dimethyltransferase RsmA [Reyranellaceae bacterium]
MSEPPPSLPPLREVIARYGLGARKALGQHFLLDQNLTGRIARAADPLDRGTVFEIGPGPGGLTRSLLAAGAHRVIAVERDPRFLPALRDLQQAYPGRLEILEADALEVNLAALGEAPRQIVANLPYNVSTPLLLGWLPRIDAFTALTLMFQKEVADRLLAKPRTKDYGRLSVAVQFHCTVKPLFQVPPSAFTPPPQVMSTVVQLRPRPERPADIDPRRLERVAAAAFGQRRKMLRAALKSLLPQPEAALHEAGIAPTARAEELDLDAFCRLARATAKIAG